MVWENNTIQTTKLFGCGVCVLWLIQESLHHPEDDLPDLLDRMELYLTR